MNLTDAVFQWFAELQLFQDKDQHGKSEKTLRAYNYRLGFFLDFSAQQNLRFLDQIDRNQLLRYVKFLREHEGDLDDRTVHNIFETLNTLLRTRTFFIDGKSLDVTLAYLKGKDAESEEAQEQANSSSLALYA